MFLEIRKNPKIFAQHNAMDAQYLAPVTSNFRINVGFIAEVSFYSIKEVTRKKSLDGMDFELPSHIRRLLGDADIEAHVVDSEASIQLALDSSDRSPTTWCWSLINVYASNGSSGYPSNR